MCCLDQYLPSWFGVPCFVVETAEKSQKNAALAVSSTSEWEQKKFLKDEG